MATKRTKSTLPISDLPARPIPTIKIDKTAWLIHVSIAEYNGLIRLFVNDKSAGIFTMKDGEKSIQLPKALPDEYRVRVEVLKK